MKFRQHTEAAPVRQGQTLVRLPSGGALHVTGPAGAQPLLFLHGVAGAAWSWEPQADALGEEFLCARWEARGHGDAGCVKDAGLADYFRDAGEALEALPADRPPFIVAHSMGGLLAMALAAEQPGKVKGLGLIEPVYNPAGTPHAAGLLAPIAGWLLSPLVASVARNGAVSQTIARMMFERSFEDRDVMKKWWPQQQLQIPLEYPTMLYEGLEGTTGFPNRAFAREIDMPVALIEGSTARSGPRFPDLVADLRAGLGERFEYHVLAGGHYLQLDRSSQVTELLHRFFHRYA